MNSLRKTLTLLGCALSGGLFMLPATAQIGPTGIGFAPSLVAPTLTDYSQIHQTQVRFDDLGTDPKTGLPISGMESFKVGLDYVDLFMSQGSGGELLLGPNGELTVKVTPGPDLAALGSGNFDLRTSLVGGNLELDCTLAAGLSLARGSTVAILSVSANTPVCGWFGLETVGSMTFIDGNSVQGKSDLLVEIAAAFQRGDANFDGTVNIADAQMILNYLFSAGPGAMPQDAYDANDDGVLDISDTSYLFAYLFGGGPQPPSPFLELGQDPTPDFLIGNPGDGEIELFSVGNL